MSNVLVIKAQPLNSEESRTLKGLETFLQHYEAKNPQDTITLLDVFKEDIPEVDGTLLSAWSTLTPGVDFSTLSKEQQHAVTRFNELTEQFLAADKIIIANPLWNLNIPTRLKAWIDTIMVAGKTFKYTTAGPVPLTTGKKAFHIQSNGGVYKGQDPASLYVKSILNFVGIQEVGEAFIEGLDYDPEHADEMLTAALEKIAQQAEEF